MTIKKIAENTGFSIPTVSRALSDKSDMVKQETREIILKEAKKIGYVKDASAQTLVTGKTKDIALTISAFFDSPYYNDYYIKVIKGITAAVSLYNYKLRVIFVKEDDKDFVNVVSEVRSLKCTGMVIVPFCQQRFFGKSELKQLDIPVVILGVEFSGENIRSVLLDDFKGGYMATNYLIRLGHKKIAILRGEDVDEEKRFEGYKKAFKEAGLKVDYTLVKQGVAIDTTGYKLTKELLKNKQRPTAIFCVGDEVAFGALNAIKECGLKCPQDISVLGYDGLEIGNFVSPRLTSIKRPSMAIGKQAVDLILNKELWEQQETILINPELVIKDSCM